MKKKVILSILALVVVAIATVSYLNLKSLKYAVLEMVSVSTSKGVYPVDSLVWCTFPSPNHDLPGGIPHGIQDVTHPSVVYISEGWNGYKLWAATSPYPQSVDGEEYENTCIYYSDPEHHEGMFNYSPITHNPVILKPDDAFNSDPDIFHDSVTDKLYVITRQCNDSIKIVIQSSEDGHTWSSEKLIIDGKRGDGYLSPCLFEKDSVYYILTFMKSKENRSIVKTANLYSSSSLEDADFELVKSIPLNGDVNVWHGDVFEYNGDLYAVVCGVNMGFKYLYGAADQSKYLFLGKMNDDFSIDFSSVPVIRANGVYRSTGFVDEDNKAHLYFSFHYRYLDDPQAYPVGHRIAYIKADFEDMLSAVKIN